MAYSLLKSEALKLHLYNFVPGVPTMEHFHQFYCEYQAQSQTWPRAILTLIKAEYRAFNLMPLKFRLHAYHLVV